MVTNPHRVTIFPSKRLHLFPVEPESPRPLPYHPANGGRPSLL